jgi:hypothetical protein
VKEGVDASGISPTLLPDHGPIELSMCYVGTGRRSHFGTLSGKKISGALNNIYHVTSLPFSMDQV